MICATCKHAQLQMGTGTSMFERQGMTLIIKDVLKLICLNCGEEYTDEHVTETLLQIAEDAEKKGVLTDIRRYKVA